MRGAGRLNDSEANPLSVPQRKLVPVWSTGVQEPETAACSTTLMPPLAERVRIWDFAPCETAATVKEETAWPKDTDAS